MKGKMGRRLVKGKYELLEREEEAETRLFVCLILIVHDLIHSVLGL